MERIKGHITREQTVWCFCCLNPNDPTTIQIRARQRVTFHHCEQHHSEAGPVAPVARRARWRMDSRYGWMCSPCLTALKELRHG